MSSHEKFGVNERIKVKLYKSRERRRREMIRKLVFLAIVNGIILILYTVFK